MCVGPACAQELRELQPDAVIAMGLPLPAADSDGCSCLLAHALDAASIDINGHPLIYTPLSAPQVRQHRHSSGIARVCADCSCKLQLSLGACVCPPHRPLPCCTVWLGSHSCRPGHTARRRNQPRRVCRQARSSGSAGNFRPRQPLGGAARCRWPATRRAALAAAGGVGAAAASARAPRVWRAQGSHPEQLAV